MAPLFRRSSEEPPARPARHSHGDTPSQQRGLRRRRGRSRCGARSTARGRLSLVSTDGLNTCGRCTGITYRFSGWMLGGRTPRSSRSQPSWQIDETVRARIALAEEAVYENAWTGAAEVRWARGRLAVGRHRLQRRPPLNPPWACRHAR